MFSFNLQHSSFIHVGYTIISRPQKYFFSQICLVGSKGKLYGPLSPTSTKCPITISCQEVGKWKSEWTSKTCHINDYVWSDNNQFRLGLNSVHSFSYFKPAQSVVDECKLSSLQYAPPLLPGRKTCVPKRYASLVPITFSFHIPLFRS